MVIEKSTCTLLLNQIDAKHSAAGLLEVYSGQISDGTGQRLEQIIEHASRMGCACSMSEIAMLDRAMWAYRERHCWPRVKIEDIPDPHEAAMTEAAARQQSAATAATAAAPKTVPSRKRKQPVIA